MERRRTERELKVLVVESFPRWEYRFLRNALSRDPGVELSCLLFHPTLGPGTGKHYIPSFPSKPEDLAPYDVIFLGDVGIGNNQLTKEQCALIRGLVENQASGVIFMPGPRWMCRASSADGARAPCPCAGPGPRG